MRLLILGAGGVGSSACAIIARRRFAESVVVADYSADRARSVVDRYGDDRFTASQVDAGDEASIRSLLDAHRVDAVLNAVDPRFVMPIFRAALAAGVTYLDMAMSLSLPHPDHPHRETGVKLGDDQFALAGAWESKGALALVGMGVEPGISDVFARHAADTLFSQVDEVGVRDGADLAVEGYDFAPTFNIWTTIEECLNPPVIYERDRGWFTTPPFSEPETFVFPDGIGPVECVNVEHEEVLLVPRWVDARRVTFKYGLGDEFIEVLRVLHKTGLDSAAAIRVGGVEVSPRRGRGGPARSRDPRGSDDRQDLRRAPGSPGSGRTVGPARCTSITWSTTSRRCATTAARRSCGRPPSAPRSRSSCSTGARGPVPASSARRPSRPTRSSTSWPTTAPRTASRTAPPPDPPPSRKLGICARRYDAFPCPVSEGRERTDVACRHERPRPLREAARLRPTR